MGDGSDWWRLLIGLVMMTLPLFSLPFIARQGGPLLSKLSGTLNGLAQKASAPLSNWSKSHEDPARAKYLANTPRRGPAGWAQRGAQQLRRNRVTREMQGKTNENLFQSQWANSGKGRTATDALGRSEIGRGFRRCRHGARVLPFVR